MHTVLRGVYKSRREEWCLELDSDDVRKCFFFAGVRNRSNFDQKVTILVRGVGSNPRFLALNQNVTCKKSWVRTRHMVRTHQNAVRVYRSGHCAHRSVFTFSLFNILMEPGPLLVGQFDQKVTFSVPAWVRTPDFGSKILKNRGFEHDIWSVRTKTRFECIVVLIVRTVASLLFLIPHNSWRQEPWCVVNLIPPKSLL